MDKMKFETPALTERNIDKIAALFPNCITETADGNGGLRRAVNFDTLKQMLSGDITEGNEAYEFTWVGKKAAMAEASKPTRKTLRPCKEESVDWDNTENLYIEGDNLEVLKLLQESYLGKVKMIYIDPPYNTGSDFIYSDTFKHSQEEENEQIGMFDEDDNRLFKNTDTNGRFHSDWCSMIYPRLLLARNLLSDDGVIFISIDDNEVSNLTKICDEVFGSMNRIALICHKSRASISNDKIISPNHNTILFYSKRIDIIEQKRKMIGLDPVLDGFDMNDNDGKGNYRLVPVDGPGGAKKGNPHFEFLGVEGYWRFSKETMQEKYNQGFVVKRGNSLYQKYFESTAATTRRTATTWWDDVGLMSTATSRLKALMGGATFDTPKPLELIDRMLRMITYDDKSSTILDFFSGSGTTAHAVMQLNAEEFAGGTSDANGVGRRKFIMVQLPELCDEKSEAYKAGYKNICEIGKERIRRAGKKIKDEMMPLETNNVKSDQISIEDIAASKKSAKAADELDTGFRVFKLADSNMEDVYYSVDEYNQDMLEQMESNIKPDRTDMDLLFGCLLEWGLPLDMPYKSEKIENCTVHTYNDGDLIACFDENIPESVIMEIAKREPLRAVFRDSSFPSVPEKINMWERFKLIAPDTRVKVI